MKPRRETPDPRLPLPRQGGALLVDKPRGLTSHDVVDRLRRLFGLRRIGHAGTLDPMATGLLVAAIGPATRLLQFLSGLDKEYEGLITLGAVSDTYDAEGEITPVVPARDPPPRERIEREMAAFEGTIQQRPPAHSAIKVQGRPLYEHARRGRPIVPAARTVRVDFFRPRDYAPPTIRFQCRVSSGTYVRSLTHDLGQALGCGAHLSQLRRTAVGVFRVEQAAAVESLESDPGQAVRRLLSPAETLPHVTRVEVGPAAARRLEHGAPFDPSEVVSAGGPVRPGEPVAALDSGGRLLAVCRYPAAGELFQPICVFPPNP